MVARGDLGAPQMMPINADRTFQHQFMNRFVCKILGLPGNQYDV